MTIDLFHCFIPDLYHNNCNLNPLEESVVLIQGSLVVKVLCFDDGLYFCRDGLSRHAFRDACLQCNRTDIVCITQNQEEMNENNEKKKKHESELLYKLLFKMWK